MKKAMLGQFDALDEEPPTDTVGQNFANNPTPKTEIATSTNQYAPQSIIDMTKIQEDLNDLMKDYKDNNIFIFQCLAPGGCSGLLMMHQEKCPWCDIRNKYYDDTLKVD